MPLFTPETIYAVPPILILLCALLAKHYVADFVLQPGWMLRTKGDLRRPGGYVHAGIHAIATAAILAAAGGGMALIAGLATGEAALHFWIDHAKDRISARRGADRSPGIYWRLHGLDQLLHQFTYVALAWIAWMQTGALAG